MSIKRRKECRTGSHLLIFLILVRCFLLFFARGFPTNAPIKAAGIINAFKISVFPVSIPDLYIGINDSKSTANAVIIPEIIPDSSEPPDNRAAQIPPIAALI